MRILYSHYLQNDDHAAVVMVHSIARELRNLGHTVLVHRSAGEAKVAEPTARPRKVPAWRKFLSAKTAAFRIASANRAAYRRDLAALKAFQPDVVLARHDAYCWSMSSACLTQHIPLVTYADAPSAHEVRTFNLEGRWHPPGMVEALERLVLSRSRAILTVSRPAARLLSRHKLQVPIHVVHNGIDASVFSDPPQRPIRKEGCVIGYVGTFRPFHGLDLLRDVICSLEHRRDLTWMLVGDGPGRAKLQQELHGRVHAVFTGKLPGEQIPDALQAIDIALVPSPNLGENYYLCPLKILECGAAGCAVLATQQGDIPQLLDQGRAGLLLSPDDPFAWRAAIEKLADNAELRIQLGERARRYILQNLTWNHTARTVERVLSEIVAERI
jgi:glycosyltransferase involved in cell wall biosynthesis